MNHFVFLFKKKGYERCQYNKARAKCGCVHVVLHTSILHTSCEYVLPVMCLLGYSDLLYPECIVCSEFKLHALSFTVIF